VFGLAATLALVASLVSCGQGTSKPRGATRPTTPGTTATTLASTTTSSIPPAGMTITGAVTGNLVEPPQGGLSCVNYQADGTAKLGDATVNVGLKGGAFSLAIPVQGVVWVFAASSSALSFEAYRGGYRLVASGVTLTGIAANPAEGKTITVSGWLPCGF